MKSVLLAALLLMTGCNDHRPPAPSTQQSDQLNDAENMLNAMAQNEEGPEAKASSPSNQPD